MAPLLGLESFPGEWISAERARASWVGEAYFDGIMLLAAWPRSDVTRMLPPGWRLAVSSRSTPAIHPLLLAFGRQRDTAVLFAGTRLHTDVSYGEVMVAVPFVVHERGRQLHTFIPWMLSEDAKATWSGNAYYGFNKHMGTLERFGRTLAATDESGALRMCATMDASGAWLAPDYDRSVESLTAIHEISRLPIVGWRADGSEVESYFDWTFAGASVKSARIALSVNEALTPETGPPAPTTATDHALQINGMRWRLSWPTVCRR